MNLKLTYILVITSPFNGWSMPSNDFCLCAQDLLCNGRERGSLADDDNFCIPIRSIACHLTERRLARQLLESCCQCQCTHYFCAIYQF